MANAPDASPHEAQVLRKAALRLVPFLGLLYFVAYLDRVNVGYAALTMNRDIGLSAAAYGLGAGIFFIGYFLFEVPSNLILEKVGARRWIARIMITWGVLSAAMALVTGPTSFYVVRFLLGVAEAGFFPGMILYLTYWFPAEQRGRIVAMFMLAIPISSVVGAPVSTALLDTSVFGLKGWQTMFLLEGAPAILMGVAVLLWLADKPATAKWLNPEERVVLQAAVDRDAADHEHHHLHGLGAALKSPRLWRFAFVYFGVVMGLYGLGFWLPQIVKGFGGLSNQQTGLITAAPYLLAAVVMYLWGRHSDRTGERTWHFVIPAGVAAAGFLIASQLADPVAQFAALTMAAIGVNAALPMFWALPTRFLRGAAAAGGIAMINSVGNLAGYLGPSVMGVLRERTGGYGAGLLALAASLAVAALLAVELRRSRAPATA
jgi:ACS family tartrate transporter-like MFS transporter